jgi:hypothetical protein
MDSQRTAREVFRCTWLTTMPEWVLAGGASLAVGLAAQLYGLQWGWDGLLLMGLPLAWAGGRTLQWACQTWIVSADGRLTIRKGILFAHRQTIRLASASEVEADALPGFRWLDIGQIAFEAEDGHGPRRTFRGTWMQSYDRLCEIVRARGHLVIGRQPWWQRLGDAAGQRMGVLLRRLARTVRRSELQDYGRFMAFCHHVLRAEQGGRWPPPGTSAALVECWIAVLQQVRVVVSAPDERGWRVAPGIAGLDDIRRRLGPPELQRAVEP